MRITILGTGVFGLSLALAFQKNGGSVTMWTKFVTEKEMLEKERRYEKVLPGIKIPVSIVFNTDIKEAILDSSLIVIAVPVSFVEDVCLTLQKYVKKDQIILIASKGIEQKNYLLMHEIVSKHIKTNQIAVISGPTFALDLASHVPVGLSLASVNVEAILTVKEALESNDIKLSETNDVIGVEICGSIKNVFAIGAGILDGMNCLVSTKALFLTEALQNISDLLVSLGGSPKTVLSLAGLGDLYLTCSSEKSRNFILGQMIGQEKSDKEIEDYKNSTTIEGLSTLESIFGIMQRENIALPIVSVIHDIICHKEDKEALCEVLMQKN